MNQFIFNSYKRNNSEEIAKAINLNFTAEKPIILCVGSDLVVGDSLGPYIGTNLVKKLQGKAFVYGTLENPVTALEIETVKKTITKLHPYSKILVIDAAVGKKEEIGYVKILSTSIKPGQGINKDLPPIGDVSIIGIVGEACKENILNQSIRFSLVYKLCIDIISGIELYFKNNNFS